MKKLKYIRYELYFAAFLNRVIVKKRNEKREVTADNNSSVISDKKCYLRLVIYVIYILNHNATFSLIYSVNII